MKRRPQNQWAPFSFASARARGCNLRVVDWTHWHNEPLLIGTIAIACWAFALALGPWRFRIAPHADFPRREVGFFAAAIVLFFLSVGSPLDQIGERFLFAAHMIQHMLIVFLVAPLLHVGMPVWLVDAVLGWKPLRVIAQVLFQPVVALLFYVLCLSIWHIPAFYDLALRIKIVHVTQHLMFLGAAWVMWWPLVSRSAIIPQRSPGAQMLYIFALGLLQFPVVAFLLFSRETLYPTYEFAPRLTGLSPHDDQVLGGTLMGVGGMFIALGLFSRSFYLWYRQSERQTPEPQPNKLSTP